MALVPPQRDGLSAADAAAWLVVRATTLDRDLQLAAEAARYESGQSAEPIQKIEQLLRDSAARPASHVS